MPDTSVTPLQLSPLERERIGLAGGRLTLAIGEPQERRPASLTLERTGYRAVVVSCREGQEARVSQGLLQCYELRPEEADVPYVWAVWSALPMLQFAVFADDDVGGVLSWVSGPAVMFADVSEPRHSAVALAEHFGSRPEPLVRVPVGDLVPAARHWGRNALARDIRVQSIERRGEDGWEVKITGPDEEKVYTLVSDDGEEWRLAE